VLGLDESFEAVEIHRPEGAVLFEPGIDGAKRFGIELVDPVAAFAVLADQVRPPQKAKVLGDGGPGDGKGSGNFSGGLAASPQQVEDSPAGGVGERLKGCGGRICNRTVTHNA
jgi:hypothetical protein